ncbi:PTPA-CTERM sorting domain-containing protein [Nodosilinea sp. PGN35]|uniref:PTPA-CTERM sorting domain-containing protein n=1 Tax=Nodosilinea sp. PGN35 TaxID=3020489 RepID=UPI0023B3454B|nr:PTPA-CTERM sorting domain-containing protein [Nodosilinea sp. TSF1-S3]MDF0365720.1 PTPA-CTERM sorting domain-containing protein [Nodosilinea sp. TSF1-S3]
MPVNVTVGSGVELTQFGGVWDIDLSANSILFDLNSVFGNVTSGNDVYRFRALNFGQPGQSLVTSFAVTALGDFAFRIPPIVNLIGGNEIEVIFPRGFAFPIPGPNEPRDPNAPNLTTVDLGLRIDLVTAPAQIPTPALLPGLMGMGLAAWRRHRRDDQDT